MFRFGPFDLDPARRLLMRHGRPVPITARAFDVLLTLLQRSGQTVAKDDFLQTVWSDAVVEDANLSQQIFTLRKILGQTEQDMYIATVPRKGYRWIAALHTIDTDHQVEPSRPFGPDTFRPVRLEIAIESGSVLPDAASPVLAISPDGSHVVYVGWDGSTTRLYLRPLHRFETSPLPGTEGALNPFFSPDGAALGFQSGRQLVRLPLTGGPPTAVCDVTALRGATWTRDGHIVYAPGPTTGLWRVPAEGGTAVPCTGLDFESGERTHRWPHALDDGRILFTIGQAGAMSFDEATLAITCSGQRHQTVLQHATDGRCLADGRLVWARGATLFAAPFDVTRGRISGDPQVIQQRVAMSATGVAHFQSSENGTLVHIEGTAPSLRRSLVTVDRSGTVKARHMTGESLEEPRYAPHGRAAVVSIRRRNSDLWLHEFASGALTRLTFGGENFAAVWGPGADAVTYSASLGGPSNLFIVYPDRPTDPELLVSSEFDKLASSWSPDGRQLAFTEYHPDTGADIWLLDRSSETVRPLILTRFNEYAPSFSPDGCHVAYVTDESGQPEIVVIAYPGATRKRQVSVGGGTEPLWSRDGRELFYRSGDRLMRIDMSGGVANAGIPTTLFEGHFVGGSITPVNYDAAASGDEFLMVLPDAAPSPRTLRVTLGWNGRQSPDQ